LYNKFLEDEQRSKSRRLIFTAIGGTALALVAVAAVIATMVKK